ncbi:MAG: type IV toxin-antitoxin system AbiEi family antitoxin domain-containing protein [Anaerolineae bacterium]|nr:type IV toxin-antitoxin system AbiEi family antitoxin domain-containing protein [Anaerolineae bacterium]
MATLQEARSLFTQYPLLRTSQALALGIAPATFYRMRDRGIIVEVARGLFRLADGPVPAHPDFVSVALRYPRAVIALLSALSYHGLTTQIPRAVYLALPQGTKRPRSTDIPLEVVWLNPTAYAAGMETVMLDGVAVRLYDAEKTLCDGFKFRTKVGEDVALDALKAYLERPSTGWDLAKLMRYARLNRVSARITPYLEALL